MVKDKTKRIAGIILLGVGFGFIPFLFQSIMMVAFLFIPLICITLGCILLYRGLSIENRGIMLLITGAIFIVLSMLLFTRGIPHISQLVMFSIVNILFWVLSLIIPGIIKMVKKKDYDENIIYIYSLAPLTTFWVLIYTIIIIGMTISAPTTFMILYWRYFIIALGGGFLLSLLVIGLAKAGIVFLPP